MCAYKTKQMLNAFLFLSILPQSIWKNPGLTTPTSATVLEEVMSAVFFWPTTISEGEKAFYYFAFALLKIIDFGGHLFQ